MAPGEKARASPWVGSCGEPCGRDSLHHFKFPNKEAQGHRAQPLLQISAGRRLLLGPNFRFLCGDSTLMIFIWTPGQPAPGQFPASPAAEWDCDTAASPSVWGDWGVTVPSETQGSRHEAEQEADSAWDPEDSVCKLSLSFFFL